MPGSLAQALEFLETQWSSINDNKIKGSEAEIRFRHYLTTRNVHFVPGGWIITPAKNEFVSVPARNMICLLPVESGFSWHSLPPNTQVTPAQIAAYLYFRQVGVKAYFVYPDEFDETSFELPVGGPGGRRPKPYNLIFKTVGTGGEFEEVDYATVMSNFPTRRDLRGTRVYQTGRQSVTTSPWSDSSYLCKLFWFEYARYFCQVDYLVSNNDLDLFIVADSGLSYPTELKSKSPFEDSNLGPCFGIDMGPFAKMAFFTANSMNTDALYVVEEVDEHRTHVAWLAIRFTELVKSCSWVGLAGGQSMQGGGSSTFKIPKAAFTPLDTLLPQL